MLHACHERPSYSPCTLIGNEGTNLSLHPQCVAGICCRSRVTETLLHKEFYSQSTNDNQSGLWIFPSWFKSPGFAESVTCASCDALRKLRLCFGHTAQALGALRDSTLYDKHDSRGDFTLSRNEQIDPKFFLRITLGQSVSIKFAPPLP